MKTCGVCQLSSCSSLKVCSLKNKAKAIGVENEELHNSLHVYKETQAELSAELLDFKEKYSEVLELLHEVQEELRRARKKGQGGRQKSVMLDSFADQGSRSVKTKGTPSQNHANAAFINTGQARLTTFTTQEFHSRIWKR